MKLKKTAKKIKQFTKLNMLMVDLLSSTYGECPGDYTKCPNGTYKICTGSYFSC